MLRKEQHSTGCLHAAPLSSTVVFLMKVSPVHIAQFSNENAMDKMSIDTASAKTSVVNPLLETKPSANSCQKGGSLKLRPSYRTASTTECDAFRFLRFR